VAILDGFFHENGLRGGRRRPVLAPEARPRNPLGDRLHPPDGLPLFLRALFDLALLAQALLEIISDSRILRMRSVPAT
jgi:hypothetical protein